MQSTPMVAPTRVLKPVMQHTDFGDLQLSTMTIIGTTTIAIDIAALFQALPIEPYETVAKRRGRRKRNETPVVPQALADGKIITLKYGEHVRGTPSRPSAARKHFRNALTVIMFIDNKTVNFKVTRNGRLQFTGCKTLDHAVHAAQHFWDMVSQLPGSYTFHEGQHDFVCTFAPAMANMDFLLGFRVDRARLDELINTTSEFCALLESSFGSNGVNIKVCHTALPDPEVRIRATADHQWIRDTVNAAEPIKACATFLVFGSGAVILSGRSRALMKGPYDMFKRFVYSHRIDIEDQN